MSPNSLTTRLIKVHVLTASYRIFGNVNVTNTGLCGILNDPTNSSMVLTDAVMARINEPDKITKKYEALRLQKLRILNACLERREDVGPRAIRAGYEQINEYEVAITDPSYEYEGIYEWSGRFDYSAMMSGGTGEFFPIIKALVRSIMYPEFELTSSAIVVNRQYLATFACVLTKQGN